MRRLRWHLHGRWGTFWNEWFDWCEEKYIPIFHLLLVGLYLLSHVPAVLLYFFTGISLNHDIRECGKTSVMYYNRHEEIPLSYKCNNCQELYRSARYEIPNSIRSPSLEREGKKEGRKEIRW